MGAGIAQCSFEGNDSERLFSRRNALSKQLKVLLSAYACMPNTGTEPGNGWNWAVHLAERGMRVHVLTVIEGKEGIEAYRAEHPDSRISFSYVKLPRCFTHRTPIHYLLWQWAALKIAKQLHQESPFDLAHHVTYSSIHVPTQLWRLGVPTIFGPVGGGQVHLAACSMLLALVDAWKYCVLHSLERFLTQYCTGSGCKR